MQMNYIWVILFRHFAVSFFNFSLWSVFRNTQTIVKFCIVHNYDIKPSDIIKIRDWTKDIYTSLLTPAMARVHFWTLFLSIWLEGFFINKLIWLSPQKTCSFKRLSVAIYPKAEAGLQPLHLDLYFQHTEFQTQCKSV